MTPHTIIIAPICELVSPLYRSGVCVLSISSIFPSISFDRHCYFSDLCGRSKLYCPFDCGFSIITSAAAHTHRSVYFRFRIVNVLGRHFYQVVYVTLKLISHEINVRSDFVQYFVNLCISGCLCVSAFFVPFLHSVRVCICKRLCTIWKSKTWY